MREMDKTDNNKARNNTNAPPSIMDSFKPMPIGINTIGRLKIIPNQGIEPFNFLEKDMINQ
jgi:hypothetical protein